MFRDTSMLVIPKHINANGLLPFLDLLALHAVSPTLTVDFGSLLRVSPAGLASLAAFVARRTDRRLGTTAEGLDTCGILGYLQRMNLPEACGWPVHGEEVTRRDPYGRFVPLEEITYPVEDLGSRVASCIAPGGEEYGHPNAGLYDTAWYLITEMANNVRQHSRGKGFVAAQTTKSDGFVRIAIADGGCGIPVSLKNAGFPWAADLSDEELIEQAMVARVSSRGKPANEGVGLSLSARLVELMGGHILVASGAGILIRGAAGTARKECIGCGAKFPGTLVAISFPKGAAADFDHKLHDAKALEIPLRSYPGSATFRP